MPVTLSQQDLLTRMEQFIRRDPAARGLISSETRYGPLCAGHLSGAAAELAASATGVALVTGFFIPGADVPACETDGPLGTLLLAAVLQQLDIDTVVLTDAACRPAVQAAADSIAFSARNIVTLEDNPLADWQQWLQQTGFRLSHLIAVERVGPSHTEDSLQGQYPADEEMLQQFCRLVPAAHHNRCHNMRGEIIDSHTAPLHELFEKLPEQKESEPEKNAETINGETDATVFSCRSIGIGDGGNEIGMGSIGWAELSRRLQGEQAPRIPCRVATHQTVIAGTSNWGAYALAAAVALLRDAVEVLRPFDVRQQEEALQQMVAEGPAVDGITGLREPTVDGLPFLTYIQPWAGIRRLLSLPE